MQVLSRCTAIAALAAVLTGCGGPPDDVAEAARKSRVAARETAAQSQPGTAQRERAAAATQRPVPRDLPPPGPSRTAGANAPAVATPDRSTAVMRQAPAIPAAGAASAPVVDDALITSRVRGLLDADREVGPLHLDVDTRAGIVTLSGTVPTAGARARASDLAKSVKDVKSVNDQLTLATG